MLNTCADEAVWALFHFPVQYLDPELRYCKFAAHQVKCSVLQKYSNCTAYANNLAGTLFNSILWRIWVASPKQEKRWTTGEQFEKRQNWTQMVLLSEFLVVLAFSAFLENSALLDVFSNFRPTKKTDFVIKFSASYFFLEISAHRSWIDWTNFGLTLSLVCVTLWQNIEAISISHEFISRR